jgi:hypothetical protein
MKLTLIIILLTLSGCSMKTLYPLGGATVGGGVGALGGPLTAAAGAGLGYAAGEMAKGNEELEQAKDTIEALTTGDIDKLVEDRLNEAKDGGFFDSILDGVYDLLTLSLIGVILWNIIPLIYTRYVHKQQKGNNEQSN